MDWAWQSPRRPGEGGLMDGLAQSIVHKALMDVCVMAAQLVLPSSCYQPAAQAHQAFALRGHVFAS